MFARLARPGLAIGLTCFVVWFGVWLYWQETHHIPSGRDIVLYLIVLPVIVLLGYVVLKRVLDGILAPTPAVVASGSATSATASSQPADGRLAADPAKAMPLVIAGVALRSAHGTEAAEVLAALKEGARPEPDTELLNGEGFPAWTSCVPDLDVEDLRSSLRPLADGDCDIEALEPDRLRAVELLAGVMHDLLLRAAEIKHTHDAVAAAARQQAVQDRITLLLPAHWLHVERALVVRYIEQVAMESMPTQRWAVDAIVHGPDNSALMAMDRISLSMQREQVSMVWLLAAADSALSDDIVSRWDAAGHLHKSGRSDGRMVGEGAAALLVANVDGYAESLPDAIRMSRTASAQLERSADETKRPDAKVLRALSTAALNNALCNAESVCAVVSDADHRTSRALELAQWLQEGFPDLAFEDDCVMLGVGCGHLGAAAALSAIVVAHHLAAERQQPVLVASVDDPTARAVLLLTPPALAKPG